MIPVDLGRIAQDLQIRRVQVEAVAQLLEEGNAVPFIARYRRERTGGLSEGVIREIQNRLARGKELSGRKQAILKTIEGQGRLTEELAAAIRGAETSKKLDDLYLPYKPKKRTKGIEARERGLEPLALRIWDRDETLTDLNAAAAEFVDPGKGLGTAEEVLEGVRHILAESISDLAQVREVMRRAVWRMGRLVTVRAPELPEGKGQDFRDYFQYSEPVSHVPPHRTLAINRGEKEGVLKVSLEVPRAEMERILLAQLPLEDHPHREIFTAATLEALNEILLPALEREVKRDLSEAAERHAVEVFARNLRSLLLQPPINDRVVLAIDPGRKACKLAVLDPGGTLLDHGVIFPLGAPMRRYEAKQTIKDLVARHNVELVAIGNGTACREIEELIAEVIAEGTHFHENPGVPFPGSAPPAEAGASAEASGADAESAASPESAAGGGSEGESDRPAGPEAQEPSAPAVTAEPTLAAADGPASDAPSPETASAGTTATVEEGPPLGSAGGEAAGGVEAAGSESSGLAPAETEAESAPQLDPAHLPPLTGGSGLDGPDEPAGGSGEGPPMEPSLAGSAGEAPMEPVPAPGAEPAGEAAVAPAPVESGEAPTPAKGVGTAAASGVEGAAEGSPEPLATPSAAAESSAGMALEAGATSEGGAKPEGGETPVEAGVEAVAEAGEGGSGVEEATEGGRSGATVRLVPAPALTQPPKGTTRLRAEREARVFKPRTPPPPPAPHPADPLLARLAYLVVNEAGAHVYSSSALAKEELPEYDAELRSAISIGRRLQDPLSELVKVDPQSIGVGQYQHDVNPKVLKQALEQVVESCVNLVGVDLNRAGVTLLARIAGLNELLARRIVEYRKEHGPFRTREQLKQVEGITEAVFTQAAGFVKVRDGDEPLDRTWVHPERYELARRLLESVGLTAEAILAPESLQELRARFDALDVPAQARQLDVSPAVLGEVMDALAEPDRDPREDSPKPIFKRGLLKLEDLTPGMPLKGTVLNVVDFGAFVDIGLKDSGLVHISQLANRYVKSPHEVVSVGDVVNVWVLTVDQERKRVSLTMIPPGTERPRPERGPRGAGERGGGGPRPDRAGPRPPRREGPGGSSAASGNGGSRESGSGERPAPAGVEASSTAVRPGMNRIPGPPLRLQQGGRGGRPGAGRAGGPGGRGGAGRPQAGARSEAATAQESPPAPRPRPKPPAPAPLPKDAVAGNVPLRSFEQLKQLYELRQKASDEGSGVGDASAAEPSGEPALSPPPANEAQAASAANGSDPSRVPADAGGEPPAPAPSGDSGAEPN
jgi:uncharacterized protein